MLKCIPRFCVEGLPKNLDFGYLWGVCVFVLFVFWFGLFFVFCLRGQGWNAGWNLGKLGSRGLLPRKLFWAICKLHLVILVNLFSQTPLPWQQ